VLPNLGLANVEFARMDAESLELADGTFDVALCALGLMYVPDTARGHSRASAASSARAGGSACSSGASEASAAGRPSFRSSRTK
jgi:hypothetical protein